MFAGAVAIAPTYRLLGLLSQPFMLVNPRDLHLHLLMSISFHVFEHAKSLIRTPDLPSSLGLALLLFQTHHQASFRFNGLVILSAYPNHSLRGQARTSLGHDVVTRCIIRGGHVHEHPSTVDRGLTHLACADRSIALKSRETATPIHYYAVHRHPHARDVSWWQHLEVVRVLIGVLFNGSQIVGLVGVKGLLM